MSRFDQLLVSHDAVSIVGAATTNYGSNVPLGSLRDNTGKFKVVVHFGTLPAGAGNITVNLCSGATTNPTAIRQPIWTGTLAELAAAVKNNELEVSVLKGALNAYNRIAVVNSGTLTAGVVTSAIVPMDPVMK